MADFASLLNQSASHVWLFIPSAIVLGALHGLEPGHSKTMMAAFIVAIRGTVTQAVLLGFSAALSHTAVVWIIAVTGLQLGQQWSGERSEAYLQIASAAIIVTIALWMAWRTWGDTHSPHHHHNEPQQIDIGRSVLTLEIFEDGVPPRWRLGVRRGMLPDEGSTRIQTLRSDGSVQSFKFVRSGDFLESVETIPEPHAFQARLLLPERSNGFEVTFEEHDHSHIDLGDEDDAHAKAHAADIRKRFDGRTITTWQIVLFGLTGGLIPCPAAITVLLLCIQLKQLSLGFILVLCFGIGLAITMVSAGVIAALSMQQLQRRWSGFNQFMKSAPYVSAVLIFFVGIYTGWLGLNAI